MARGTLKSSFNDNGYTFIKPEGDGDADVFLNIVHIASGEDAKLYVRGAHVEFDIVMVTRGPAEKPQARKCRLIATSSAYDVSSSEEHVGRSGHVKFWSATGFGFLVDDASGEEIYANTDSVPGGYLRDGDIIEFDIRVRNERRQAINVRQAGWTKTQDRFTDELDMGSPKWAVQLAALAEPEPWNYTETPSKDEYTVLRSYLKYTFLRLCELADHLVVSADEGHMSFNTGLVTPFQEQIYALFRARPNAEAGPQWMFRSFEKESSFVFLTLFGGSRPPLARYYDDPSQLVYDTSLTLSVNVEHVPHDPDRFSGALKSMTAQDLAGLVNAKAPEAIDRVRRNYKTAIPQFYRDGKSGDGKMQLLLPVALLSRDKVELALTVDRLESGVYLGRTVLTLDWAYNNARLLTRPDTDWLRP